MNLIDSIKLIFKDPKKYCMWIKNRTKKESFIFTLKAFSIFIVMFFLLNIRNIYSRTTASNNNIFAVILSGYLMYLIFATIMIFLGASILHMFAKMFNSTEKFKDTYAIYSYGSLPYALIGWIPYVKMVGLIYGVYIQFIALQKGHYFSKKKAIWAYSLHVLTLLLIYVVLGFILAF